MSRYAFRDYAEDLLRSRQGVYAEATLKRERRRLGRIFRDVLALSDEGKLSTTSPKLFTEEDIRIYLSWRRSKNYSRSEYSHEIFTLKNICDFAGNAVVHNVLRMYPNLAPSGAGHVRLPSLTEAQVSASTDAAQALTISEKLRPSRAAALFALALGGGLRTKELLALDMASIDAESHVVNLIHVKGEMTYGSRRSVIITPVCWNIFSSYLRIRERFANGSAAVFVSSKGARISDNAARVDLELVSRDAGVHLDYRILRRTFGQRLIDEGLPLQVVSVLLGHSSTRTTEHYYCRLSNEDALSALREIYKKNSKEIESGSAGRGRHIPSSQGFSVSAVLPWVSFGSPTMFGTC